MTQTHSRPAVNGAAAEQVGQTSSHATHLPELPHARAYAGPPCRGRRLWLVVVLTCPCCGTAHAHRVGETARLFSHRVDKACPVTGQWYRLGPVQRRREARRG